MKRLSLFFITVVLMLSQAVVAYADTSSCLTADNASDNAVEAISSDFDVPAKSAILMDYNTGTVLYEKNADEALPPASVTKVMTLLLIMEAVDRGEMSLTDTVSVSENAASMGGSQVFLEPGESMVAEDLLKSIVIASANDAALTMAEAVCGSESAFVARMNERAAELGMNSTHFENVTGLDDETTNHVTSARDIAIMSRELMKHKKIFDFTTVWMDSIRNGEFGLTNTNRLIRFYSGATGLKTGSTSKAKFCISATAEREGLHLIAVIMGADTRDIRNEAAKTLLDFGFANYSIYKGDGGSVKDIPVTGGNINSISGIYDGCELLLAKGKNGNVTTETVIEEPLCAPISKGQKVGYVKYCIDGELIEKADIISDTEVPKISFSDILKRLLCGFLLK